MTPIEVLRKHYVGKKITSVPTGLGRILGATVLHLEFEQYETILVFTIRFDETDGSTDTVDILVTWNLEIE